MSKNNDYNPLLQNSDITGGQNGQSAPSVQRVEKEDKLIDIRPCTKMVNFEDDPKYQKLALSLDQQSEMSAIAANLPNLVHAGAAVTAASVANDFYIMTLPKGLSSSLLRYKSGGYGNVLRSANGQFVQHVPLERTDISGALTAGAIASSVFAVMSVATSQYYLKQINEKMDRIRLGVDKILEFLYGDKKAELMAEVSFTKYAMNNFTSIMDREQQRIATIASIQQAKKIAMKDAEFYISDLEATLNENIGITAKVDKALQIEESLSLALQLCVMSTILEVEYSQNYDRAYLKYLEDDVSLYIDKTEKMIIGLFNQLQAIVASNNPNLWNQFDKDGLQQKIAKILDKFRNGGESELTRSLREGLHAAEQPVTYYINRHGDVYIKSA